MIRSILLLLVGLALLLSAPFGGAAEPIKYPETPAGQKLSAWVEIINAKDYAGAEKLHAGDPPLILKRRALLDYRIALRTGGIEPHSILRAEGQSIELLAWEKLRRIWLRITLKFAEAEPHQMLTVDIRPSDPPKDAPAAPKMNELEWIKNFDALLTREAAADEFSGTALIGKEGKVLFDKAFGQALKNPPTPMQIDTKLNLASAGKMFTAVSIAQLDQAGKLSYQDNVGKHLPDYPNADVREKVTIQQLLSHTSGLGDMFNNENYRRNRGNLRTVKDYLALFAEDHLKYEPGTRWSYSNAGFCVLGAIIEKASGEDYYEYLQKHIFDPVGMKNTGAFEMDKPQKNLAHGYTRNQAKTPEDLLARRDNTDLHVIKGGPAGGSFSTVEDLFAFGEAIRGHKLVDEKHAALLLNGPENAETLEGAKRSFGFMTQFENGVRIVGHDGAFDGISTCFAMLPEKGYTVIVLSNYDDMAPILALQARRWITG